MNNETLMKIASKVIENRIRQQQALELLKQAGIKENVPDINKDAFIFGNDFLAFLAGIPGASGTAAGKAKELASHGAGAVGSAAGTAAGKAKELASHGAGAVGSAAGTAFESAKGLAGRGAGAAFESAKGLAGRGAGAARDLARKVKALTASGAGTAAEWGSKGLSAVRGVGSKILANPYARYGGLGAGVLGAGALGAYGLSHLLGGGGEAVPAAPAAPAVAVPAAPAAPAVPDMAAGGGLLTPTYLDLLLANAPIAGAVAGGLGGATIGAVASRKARIRNALIGLATGAALGGGAGYLMNR